MKKITGRQVREALRDPGLKRDYARFVHDYMDPTRNLTNMRSTALYPDNDRVTEIEIRGMPGPIYGQSAFYLDEGPGKSFAQHPIYKVSTAVESKKRFARSPRLHSFLEVEVFFNSLGEAANFDPKSLGLPERTVWGFEVRYKVLINNRT